MSPLTVQNFAANISRDITWDRPLFRPPVLNPRVMFDPLPFTAHRINQTPRQNAR